MPKDVLQHIASFLSPGPNETALAVIKNLGNLSQTCKELNEVFHADLIEHTFSVEDLEEFNDEKAVDLKKRIKAWRESAFPNIKEPLKVLERDITQYLLKQARIAIEDDIQDVFQNSEVNEGREGDRQIMIADVIFEDGFFESENQKKNRMRMKVLQQLALYDSPSTQFTSSKWAAQNLLRRSIGQQDNSYDIFLPFAHNEFLVDLASQMADFQFDLGDDQSIIGIPFAEMEKAILALPPSGKMVFLEAAAIQYLKNPLEDLSKLIQEEAQSPVFPILMVKIIEELVSDRDPKAGSRIMQVVGPPTQSDL